MTRLARVVPVLALILTMALLAGSATPVAHAQESSFATAAATVDNALFDAQSALAIDDRPATGQHARGARTAAAPLVTAFPPNSAALARLTAALDRAVSSAESGDALGLAAARGEVDTAIFLGAYDGAVAAIQAGDAATASQWLLVREFRDSTRFARPAADAALALRAFASGSIDAGTTIAALDADLLDAYQARLDASLAGAADAATRGFAARLAENAARAAGYWAILAPSYERQFGADARLAADATFAGLAAATLSGDVAALETARLAALDISASFRAAPLGEAEQGRRAGQLLLYLGLVPVEYGRGVSQGRVVVDIEIEEARTFLDGARAAFNDLRLPLSRIDPSRVQSIAATLDALDAAINAAADRQVVADPDEIERDAASAVSSLKALLPPEWERSGGVADFDVVASLLDQMEKAVAAKQYQQAESARLEAYAIYDAGPEKRLLAFSPALVAKIEQLFWQGTGDHDGLANGLSARLSSAKIRATRLALDAALEEAKLTLGAGRPATGAVIFNAATIVFREGLEAILILASLLASMIGANRRYKKPLAIGALAALVSAAVLFVLARSVLLSLNRYGEKVEAVVSVIAIGVLLLVLNWFFHKVYWTRWIAKHHNRRRALLGGAAGQAVGLGMLGFTSVFREGAETVVFLQALVLDAGTWVVIQGTLLGLLGVAAIGALTFVLQAKLPHKKMLIVTGILISAVLVTMVGNTVHVLQVVGWAPVTPVGGIEIPYWVSVWFGFYATWEGVAAQAFAAVFVVGSYYLAEHTNHRRQVVAMRAAPAAHS